MNGKHVVAFFGSEGLYCYDMKGDLKWKTDFGILKSVFYLMEQAEWEFASSPILYDGVIIVQCDVLNNSFVAALDAETGKEVYKEKLGKMKSFTGSPVASDGKIYIADEEGNVYVFKAGPEFSLLSVNPSGISA